MTRDKYVDIFEKYLVIRPRWVFSRIQATHLLNGTINSSASMLPEPSTSILSAVDPEASPCAVGYASC